MSYSDFSIDSIAGDLGLVVIQADLSPGLLPLPVLPWLKEFSNRGGRQVLLSEKAESEFIVVPILLACADLIPGQTATYSGQRLDVDAARGLVGECDFVSVLQTPS